MNNSLRPLILPALLCVLLGYGILPVSGAQREPPASKPAAKINLNSAAERELMSLPDVTFPQVRKIVANRPYEDTHELVSKGIISEATYGRIRDRITVKEAAPQRLVLQLP